MLLIACRTSSWVRSNEIWLCTLISVVSVGVVAYFTPMVLLLVVLYIWLRAESGWKSAMINLALTLMIAVPGILLMMWICGGLLTNMVSGGAAYGTVPLNLAAYIDPGPFSRLFPGFGVGPTESFHWESYAWLGVCIMVSAVILIGFKRAGKSTISVSLWKVAISFCVAGMIFVVFAATHILRFGESVIFSSPLNDSVLSLFSSFRSSARVGWPVWYILAFLIIGELASIKAFIEVRIALLAGLLAFQVWDAWAFKTVLHEPNRRAQN